MVAMVSAFSRHMDCSINDTALMICHLTAKLNYEQAALLTIQLGW